MGRKGSRCVYHLAISDVLWSAVIEVELLLSLHVHYEKGP